MAVAERREFTGAAPSTTLNGAINASATTVVLTDGTGYPTGATGPFWIVVDPGTSSEEKIKCLSRTGNSITVVTSPSTGRGSDSTSATSHVDGSTVQHVYPATEADVVNQHIADAAVDNHTQYLNTTRHDTTTRHTLGSVIPLGVAGDIGRLAAATSSTAGSSGKVADAGHAHQEPIVPATRIWRSTNQAITTSTPTFITFDVEIYDTDSMWTSGAATRVTFTHTGLYLVVGYVPWDDPGASITRDAAISVNGATGSGFMRLSRSVGSGALLQQTTWMRQFTAGEYVGLLVNHNRGSNLNVVASGNDDKATLEVTRLGPLT